MVHVQFCIRYAYPSKPRHVLRIEAPPYASHMLRSLTHNVCVEVPRDGRVDGLGKLGPQRRGDLWDSVRADTSLVVHHLLRVVIFLEEREELNDVGVLHRQVNFHGCI